MTSPESKQLTPGATAAKRSWSLFRLFRREHDASTVAIEDKQADIANFQAQDLAEFKTHSAEEQCADIHKLSKILRYYLEKNGRNDIYADKELERPILLSHSTARFDFLSMEFLEAGQTSATMTDLRFCFEIIGAEEEDGDGGGVYRLTNRRENGQISVARPFSFHIAAPSLVQERYENTRLGYFQVLQAILVQEIPADIWLQYIASANPSE